MKSIGIVRPVDELGRIVIPKELRRTMNIPDHTPMEIYVDGDVICLKKYQPGCVLCEAMENTHDFHGHTICEKCIIEASNLYMGKTEKK